MQRIASVLLIACLACVATAQTPPPRAGEDKPVPRKPADAPAKDQPPASGDGKDAKGKPTDKGGAETPREITLPAPKPDPREAAPAQPRPISVLTMLNSPVANIDFDQAPLSAVMQQIANLTGTNIIVRWRFLEEAGIGQDTPISLRLRNVRVREVLRAVLDAAEGADDTVKLGYRASREMIVISTVADLGDEMIVKVYDVRTIIATATASPGIGTGRTSDYIAGLDPVVAPGAVAFQPRIGQVFSGVEVLVPRNDEDETDPARTMQELIDVITSTIDPESWQANGGPGSIRPWRGNLIVRASPWVHQQLGGPVGKR